LTVYPLTVLSQSIGRLQGRAAALGRDMGQSVKSFILHMYYFLDKGRKEEGLKTKYIAYILLQHMP
jgi:hypothetical protein